MDLAYHLIDKIHRTRFDSLPDELVATTKHFILDNLGSAAASSSAPGIAELLDLVRNMGGKQESTVWVFGDRVPAYLATMVNATMAHARALDDTHDVALVHPYGPTLSAALATAEAHGPISGPELLAALAAGIDFLVRVGLGCTHTLTWTRTSTIGGMAAAAVAAKLRRLSRDQLHHAVGIAYAQAAGNSQTSVDGALVKRMQPGFAAKAGILSAELAARGVTGPVEIFEGKHGYFVLYEQGRYRRARVLDALEDRYEGTTVSVKPYPCARDMHGAIDAALEIASNHVFVPEEVEKVTVTGTKPLVDFCGTLFDEITGNRVVQAIINAPYCVALALSRKAVILTDFTEESVADPVMGALARKVVCVLDTEARDLDLMTPATVEVRLWDGRVLTARSDVMRGDPRRPFTRAEFEAKFRTNVKHAARSFDEASVDAIVAAAHGLERLHDVASLVRLMVPA